VVTSDSSWKPDLGTIPASSTQHGQLGSRAVGKLEQVLVEAALGLVLGVGAQTPFHVAQVSGGQVNLNVDRLSSGVCSSDDSLVVFTSNLVVLWTSRWISADTTI